VRRSLDLVTLVNPLFSLPALWLLGIGLSQVHVFSFQRNWSAFTWLLVLLAPAAFVVGGALGRAVAGHWVRGPRQSAAELGPGRTHRLRIVLVACLAVGYLELAHQFAGAGGIPLFAQNIDAARAAQPNGPTVVLTDLLIVATVLALITPRRLLSRAALPELGVAAVAAFGFLLAGGRGTIAIGLATAAIGRMLLWKPARWRVLLPGLVLALGALVTVFFIRSGQHRGQPFEHELFTSALPSTPLLLRPLLAFHVGLTTNFYALDQLTDQFPTAYGWGHGAYSLSAFDAVVPGTHSLQDVSAAVSPPFITSTAAGPYFADAGLVGVVVGMALFGAVTVAAYTWARRSGTLVACMIGAYLTYIGLFGVYTNLFTEHPDWAIVIPCLLLAGRFVSLPEEYGLRRAGRALEADARWYASRAGAGGATAMRRLRSAPSALAATRSPLRRRRLIVLFVAILVLAGAAVAVQSLRKSPEPKAVAATLSDRFALPEGAFAANGYTLATDADMPQDNAPLWVVGPARGEKRIVRQILFSGATEQDKVTSLRTGREPSGTRYAVAGWTGGETAAFQIDPRPRGVAVRVLSLDGKSKEQSRSLAPLPALPAGERDVAVATWKPGELPSLFVIDHGQERERVTVTVFSGQSAFRTRVARFTLPLRGLPNSAWALSIARGVGNRPNFVGVLRKGRSQRPEVHVLSGDSGFQRFVVQSPIATPTLAPGAVTLPGISLGRPSIYVVDPQKPQLLVFPYASASATPPG
jgi:oligosaccharide repeat unit polymerase